MTETQVLRLSGILQRHLKNDADIKTVVQEIEVVIDNKFGDNKAFAEKTEIGLLSKDLEVLKAELKNQIESSSLRMEGKLKSSINELMVWIIAMIFTTATLFFVVTKLVH